MDIFGKALYEYYSGDRDKFYFTDLKGKKYPHDLKRYFRSYKQLSRLEKKLISLSYGDILDVGCATGYYIPNLMKQGKVLGIDISKKAIKVAKIKGIKNCKVADIFKFKTKNKFDTITLLENNLGMGESKAGAERLLKILSSLLKKNGQIIAISKKIENGDFFKAEIYPWWKNKKGPKFKWISFNMNFLSRICDKAGLNLKILGKDKYNYLIRITKKSLVGSFKQVLISSKNRHFYNKTFQFFLNLSPIHGSERVL